MAAMIKFPLYIQQIIKTVNSASLEIYLVGGAVRNLILGRAITNWDFTTNGHPEEIVRLFQAAFLEQDQKKSWLASEPFYNNIYGMVGVPVLENDKKEVVEITTFRTENGYSDRRHPDKVSWGKTIEEDLSRRDFTINALALRVTPNLSELNLDRLPLIDLFGGRKDIDHKFIRAVGEAEERFKEDALRLMRAVRFATQLGFIIEEKTFTAIQNNASLIKNVSGERIRDEVIKILSSDFASDGFLLLRNTNLLGEILPELEKSFGVEQKSPGRHHIDDVGTHSIKALKFCPSNDPLVRLATLLHDIGKPVVVSHDEKGTITFYNHEVIGASMIRNIADRWHFSKNEREKLVMLVRWHQFTTDEFITDSAIRRFIRRVGVDNISDMLNLRIGDRLGSGCTEAESWRLKKFKERAEQLLHPPFSINDMAVDGNDIMKVLEIEPGPKVGQILNKLFEEIEEEKLKNTKEDLLKRVQELG